MAIREAYSHSSNREVVSELTSTLFGGMRGGVRDAASLLNFAHSSEGLISICRLHSLKQRQGFRVGDYSTLLFSILTIF